MPELGMPLTLQQERFGDAFLLAVAAAAGIAAAKPEVDYDSIDYTLSCKLPRRPKLDIQMKTTGRDDQEGPTISYPLKRKNYDDLIVVDVVVPRILVLVVVPQDTADWLALSPDQFSLRYSAYWMSLVGGEPSDNEYTVTINIPRENLFTVDAVSGMMSRIDEAGTL
jgi:hypothetical protein